MKPAKIQPGKKLNIKIPLGDKRVAFFVQRIPASVGGRAINFLRFPDFEGMASPDDKGICQMSDYDLARRGEYA